MPTDQTHSTACPDATVTFLTVSAAAAAYHADIERCRDPSTADATAAKHCADATAAAHQLVTLPAACIGDLLAKLTVYRDARDSVHAPPLLDAIVDDAIRLSGGTPEPPAARPADDLRSRLAEICRDSGVIWTKRHMFDRYHVDSLSALSDVQVRDAMIRLAAAPL
jgi:hypothetical protein